MTTLYSRVQYCKSSRGLPLPGFSHSDKVCMQAGEDSRQQQHWHLGTALMLLLYTHLLPQFLVCLLLHCSWPPDDQLKQPCMPLAFVRRAWHCKSPAARVIAAAAVNFPVLHVKTESPTTTTQHTACCCGNILTRPCELQHFLQLWACLVEVTTLDLLLRCAPRGQPFRQVPPNLLTHFLLKRIRPPHQQHQHHGHERHNDAADSNTQQEAVLLQAEAHTE